MLTGLRKRNSVTKTPTELKWIRDIGCVEEGTLYVIRLATRNTFLQTFHYRIVSRIIATNTFLHRIGRSESPTCDLCRSHDETLYHLFWGCAVVQNFIENIKTYLKDKFNIHLGCRAKRWFFPRVEQGNIIMLIITLMKLAIFKSKRNQGRPHLNRFIALLKIEAQKEQLYFRRLKKENAFVQKCSFLNQGMSEPRHF